MMRDSSLQLVWEFNPLCNPLLPSVPHLHSKAKDELLYSRNLLLNAMACVLVLNPDYLSQPTKRQVDQDNRYCNVTRCSGINC